MFSSEEQLNPYSTHLTCCLPFPCRSPLSRLQDIFSLTQRTVKGDEEEVVLQVRSREGLQYSSGLARGLQGQHTGAAAAPLPPPPLLMPQASALLPVLAAA